LCVDTPERHIVTWTLEGVMPGDEVTEKWLHECHLSFLGFLIHGSSFMVDVFVLLSFPHSEDTHAPDEGRSWRL
jgi:hypothetical protein